MNVLSLFDGCGGARVALQMANIRVDSYYSCEIDKSAIDVLKFNWVDIKHIGDIKNLNVNDLPRIDLIIGGPECKTYSVGGNQDFADIWQFKLCRELIDELKPKYYLLENVKMSGAIQDKINKIMYHRPVLINSKIAVPQNRNRNYWTNLKFNSDEFKDITLSDICDDNSIPICLSSSGRGIKGIERRMSDNKKAHTLTKTGYSRRSFSGFITNDIKIREFSQKELELVAGFPVGYTKCLELNKAKQVLGNAFTPAIIAGFLKGINKYSGVVE